MRKLKFRIWNKKDKKFLEPFPYSISSQGEVITGDGQGILILDNQENFVIQQYIGIFDWEGNYIYEGDILEHCIVPYFGAKESYIRKVVVYNNTEAKFEVEDYGIPLSEIDDWKIVGNILENRNLLDD